jgi:hypothetical protein
MPVTRQRQIGNEAFTLTDLLVVMGAMVMLVAVLLSVAFTTQERVLRAQCTDNLRQIGVGWNIYQQEFNQVMPCYWKGVTTNLSSGIANPWVTSEVYRIDSGYPLPTIGDQGPWNLGILFATRLVPNPKIFYCPSLARLTNIFSYDYYVTPSNSWPFGVSPAYVRTGYNYYPQLRATEYAGMGQFVPRAAVTPTKWTALNTKKSIVTDLVDSTNTLSHQDSGIVAGLNALFPDGRVVFQNARTDPRTGFNSPWYSSYWASPGPGHNPNDFRIIMNDWNP